MARLKCVIAYDGTRFSGYQVQPNQRTVQEELEAALKRMHKGKAIRVTASGRTDAGVHAVGQTIHFDSPLAIPEENWCRALNTLLPDDILIKQAQGVADDFHARFDVSQKEYRYRILNRKEADLFRRFYTYHVPDILDIQAMREATTHIIGTHDFSAFCAAGTQVVDKVRTVYDVRIEQQGDELVIAMVGSGFLYQMVRIAVGNLLAVGQGKAPPAAIAAILETKDRRKAFATAPPQGLYLWEVGYDTDNSHAVNAN
ncbi:tRNA pseudouridine synthase A 1 [Pullulanibacillus camelliae]|uniref:tRNA pseudouridine synthase A n=1 Tax=Pullulanibacillus camelliae TaxID=1707096 RepID=A0A8J3E0J4_9BACL|nr:tRNA pseudouridine(38-40) synthase TruA [Pullulanibacillus camelliae]GGE54623.1 tRNA pseudouridine synthase A 1 [Pullulanibacillus camelliae]